MSLALGQSTQPSALVNVAYDSSRSMAAALQRHALWFSQRVLPGAVPPGLASRLKQHTHGTLSGLTLDAPQPDDLSWLSHHAPYCFVNEPAALSRGFEGPDLLRQLAALGFKLFMREPQLAEGSGGLPRRTVIGSAEFLLSSPTRLDSYPELGQAMMRQEDAQRGWRHRAVAVLDLIQDFEVLRPLMALAASPGSPFELVVSVSPRVSGSPLWPAIEQFLQAYGVPWFNPVGPVDVAQALGRDKSLLLTASESSAPGHAFCHTACRTAPSKALRVTLQHGLECIGLRHHRAHDMDFPSDVRFASDLVLTWAHTRDLPSLHPAEAHKCVAVGVVKAMAERAAVQAEQQWMGRSVGTAHLTPSVRKLLVAENLHSVRFRDATRYKRFLRFIHAAAEADDLELTIRSHPGKRTLESQQASNQLRFLEGLIRTEDLVQFHGFVSPPSTIVLDAVLAGVPTWVWTDAPASGETANYAGLPVVTDFEQWLAEADRPAAAQSLSALDWAAQSTASFNGTPFAWNTLVRMFG
jgi:hypothetical protein